VRIGQNSVKSAGGDQETGRENPCLPTANPAKPGIGDADLFIVDELVTLLAAHPGGLRRWSVMQAIRRNRGRTARPVSLRFESEIERVFRSLCGEGTERSVQNGSSFLFYRPEGKAGEVWALRQDQAAAWYAGAGRADGADSLQEPVCAPEKFSR
jgi:hypothetical protein